MQELEQINIHSKIIDKNALKNFKTIISVLNRYHGELLFTVKDKGLYFCNLDSSAVVLNEVFIQLNNLSSNTDKFKFQVNAKELNNFLKCFKKEVNIYLNDRELVLKDDNQEYTLKLIDCSSLEHDKNDQISFTEEPINISSKDFMEHLKTFKEYGTLELEITDRTLNLNVKENSIILKRNLEKNINKKSSYSIDYLSKLKALKNFDLNLSFKTDYPLKLEFITDHITYKMLLAPRVEN